LLLRPHSERNNLELLAKALSFVKPAPLWDGVASCGHGAIIKRTLPFLTKPIDYSFCGPAIDSAVWTGTAQFILDSHRAGPDNSHTITGADVWAFSMTVRPDTWMPASSISPPWVDHLWHIAD
jgi:hypothetical protein